MDNEFGIIGYKKESRNINKTGYIILTEILVYMFICLIISTIFDLFGINIIKRIVFYILFFILSVIITMIIKKEIKDLQNKKEYYLYIYFKDKKYVKNYLYLDAHFDEIVNYIIENNIKYLKKNDFYYSIEFNIYNDERMALYNKLKDQCEVVNY